MGKLIAGIVIAILVSSAITVGASTILAVGPQGPQGESGPQGPQGEPGIGFEPTGYISIPPSAFVSEDNPLTLLSTGMGSEIWILLITHISMGQFSFPTELPSQILRSTGMMQMQAWI